MKNISKLDDEDVIFINRPWTDKEKKEFSDFLKKRKVKSARRKQLSLTKKINSSI